MHPRPLAHSQNDAGKTHDLEDHLSAVANSAADFANAFGSDSYARLAGLWHDLGKNALDFQKRLQDSCDANTEDTVPGKVDHSSAGAIHALDVLRFGLGLPLAFVIAGHHTGLADRTALDERLSDPKKRDRLSA